MRTLLFLPLGAVLAWGQMSAPRLGVLVDPAGRVRPVEGVPGALRLGDPLAEDVLSAAASDREVLWKTQDEIVSDGGRRWAAPPGPALFAFLPDGRPGVVWFADQRRLARWNDGRLEDMPYDPPGRVTALACRGAGVLVVLSESRHGRRGMDLDSATGRLLADRELERPALLDSDGVLYNPASLGVPDGASWAPFAAGYLLVDGPEGRELLRLRDGERFLLPGMGAP